MPSGCAALNVLRVTSLNALAVAVPNAAVAPLIGADTASLMVAPAGMGGYFDAAAVVPVLPAPDVAFLDELPQAARTIRPDVATAMYERRRCRSIAPPFPSLVRREVPPGRIPVGAR